MEKKFTSIERPPLKFLPDMACSFFEDDNLWNEVFKFVVKYNFPTGKDVRFVETGGYILYSDGHFHFKPKYQQGFPHRMISNALFIELLKGDKYPINHE